MRGEDHGLGLAQAPDQAPHLDDLVGIEAGGGLIEHQDLGVVQQGGRESHALAVALRELADRAGEHPADAAGVHHHRQATTARVEVEAAHLRHEAQVILDQHVVVERRVLRQIADPFLHRQWLLDHVESGHRRGARTRQEVADHDLDRGGLAGPVGTEQAHHLAARESRTRCPSGHASRRRIFRFLGVRSSVSVDQRERKSHAPWRVKDGLNS